MNIKFAFAVNHDGFFQKNHFGDAEKYLKPSMKNWQINLKAIGFLPSNMEL